MLQHLDSTDFVNWGYDLLELDGYLLQWDKVQQSTDHSDQGEANISTVKMVMARLKNEFHRLLATYTTSIEYDSDSSFSSTPSHVRLSINTNNTMDEISDLDPQIEELASSPNHMVPVQELLQEEQQDNSGQHWNFPSIISIPELNLLPIQAQAIYYLRCIAERLIAAGYTQECVESYCRTRLQLMDANLIKLGIETLNFRQVQLLEPNVLARKIKSWIKSAKIAFEMFANEKLLANRIFNGLSWVDPALDEFCLMQTIKNPAMQLLIFAEAISQQTSPERLFMLSDVYKALSELLPDIEIIFEGKRLEAIHAQAVRILSKLADAARWMLECLEKSLINEIGSIVPEGGDILDLNKYVMKYLRCISDHAQPLSYLIDSKPPLMELENISDNLNMDFVSRAEEMSPLALHLNWIITILLFKLNQKSKLYTNASLAHLFMMNNIHYMTWTIESSQRLKAVVGDDSDCLKMLTVQFRIAAIAYERSTWSIPLRCLHSNMTNSGVKERIKSFNAQFEEACKVQAKWSVPDVYLRQELRLSISQKLILAYQSLVGRYGHVPHHGKYIKYSVEEIENAALNLFEGYVPRRRRYLNQM